tara:strand:+ start:11107 stop:11691 length:585 start_codon:yes stop_codon:yes gene_type:complete
MTTNHERFLHHLDASEKGVSFVSDWLSDFGVDVSHGQITKAKEAKDWKKHVDSGDLFIKQRVEVKKLSYCFSTTHWPHGKKFLVCAKHSFDNASPRPFMYVYVSGDEQCIAVVKSETWRKWRTGEFPDRRYEGNSTQPCYYASLDCVKFFSVSKDESDETSDDHGRSTAATGEAEYSLPLHEQSCCDTQVSSAR